MQRVPPLQRRSQRYSAAVSQFCLGQFVTSAENVCSVLWLCSANTCPVTPSLGSVLPRLSAARAWPSPAAPASACGGAPLGEPFEGSELCLRTGQQNELCKAFREGASTQTSGSCLTSSCLIYDCYFWFPDRV